MAFGGTAVAVCWIICDLVASITVSVAAILVRVLTLSLYSVFKDRVVKLVPTVSPKSKIKIGITSSRGIFLSSML